MPPDDSLQIAENESISTIYVKPKLEKKNLVNVAKHTERQLYEGSE